MPQIKRSLTSGKHLHFANGGKKMGHELHGDWQLYVVKAINSQGDLGLFPDGTIHFEMPNASSNAMQTGSKHGANDLVRGTATAVNGVYSVKFDEQLTTGG